MLILDEIAEIVALLTSLLTSYAQAVFTQTVHIGVGKVRFCSIVNCCCPADSDCWSLLSVCSLYYCSQ